MSEPVDIRKVEIDPIGCYKQALELLEGRYWLLLGISAVGTFIASAVPIVLLGPMMCGIYVCFLRAYRGDDLEFGSLFEGFDHLVPSLIASLIITGVSMVALVPGFLVLFTGMLMSVASLQADGGQGAVPGFASLTAILLSALIFMVLILLVSTFFIFAFPLIVDRKLDATDALATSARAAARNFAALLGLMLINAALGLVGALACYVGSLFVMPLGLGAMTVAYRKVFPEMAAEASPAE